jgi:hypothetical protein
VSIYTEAAVAEQQTLRKETHMRLSLLIVAAFLFVTTYQARASVLYSTTDLGASYQLKSNAGGEIYGVTNATGQVVYAFDKSPVTPIHLQTNDSVHDAYTVLTMQNGSHQVGYTFDNLLGQFAYVPTFEPILNGWQTYTVSPVADLNGNGQVVGKSINFTTGLYYAAFSDVNGQSHGYNAAITDNVNNYINSIPGVTLTSAVKIDDLGRILASGSNGDQYLLTPVGLGQPVTIPEPSSIISFCLVAEFLRRHSIRRKRLR